MGDERLKFAEKPYSWRIGAKQNLLGSEYATYEPKVKIQQQPSIVEFEIESNQTFLFGPDSKFEIDGMFQSQTTGEDWTPVATEDWENVVVAPNWLDMLVKKINVNQGQSLLSTANEAMHISPFLNAYFYNYMDPLAKKLLCPQDCHPGYGIPSTSKGWTWTETDGDEWKKYAAKIFTGKSIEFDYIPMHVFPFFQRANFLVDNNMPSPFPLPALGGKLTVSILFNDKLDNIFKKKAGNEKKYRFAFNSIKLIIEQARLNPTFERQLYSHKNPLYYGGVTKIMTEETINAGNLTQRIRIDQIPFPEGIFIFALPKKCLSGTYTYQESVNDNVFSPHNIEQIGIQYNGLPFYMKDLNMSMINNNVIEVKSLINHLAAPPFGMVMDPKKLSLESIQEGGKNTPYPHVYINLCNFSDKSRIVPLGNDASILDQNHDLDLHLKFHNGGATQDVTYFFYAFFTDTNMVLDMKTKKFYSPYLKQSMSKNAFFSN